MLKGTQSDRQGDQSIDSLVPYSKGMNVVVVDVVVVIIVSYAIVSLKLDLYDKNNLQIH